MNAFTSTPLEMALRLASRLEHGLTHYNQTRPHSIFNGQTPDEVYNERNLSGHTPDSKKDMPLVATNKRRSINQPVA